MAGAVGADNWRNVAILGASTALAASAGPLVTLSGGIVGQALAPTPILATLPVTALIIGLASGAVPAALLMRRIGRRAGFVTGAAVSAASALMAASAITAASFAAFCAATFVMGAAGAFAQQYRFAAAESVDARHTGRAVSLVMVGGIIAGALGPEIGRRGRHLFGSEFSGGFVVVAVVQLVALGLLTGLRIPPASVAHDGHQPVSIRALFARPSFVLAVFAAAGAAAVMSFLMTATPISMHVHDSHSIDDAAFVIQSHVIAMFGPSLMTGWLVDRLGLKRMMTAGALVLIASVGVTASSHALWAYWLGLVLLGLGWNLLFIGATVLLTKSYTPAEQYRAQGLNDVTVFGSQAMASLASGAVLYRFGWVAMSLATAPILLLVLALIVVTRRKASSGLTS
jgi:MFS family permease